MSSQKGIGAESGHLRIQPNLIHLRLSKVAGMPTESHTRLLN